MVGLAVGLIRHHFCQSPSSPARSAGFKYWSCSSPQNSMEFIASPVEAPRPVTASLESSPVGPDTLKAPEYSPPPLSDEPEETKAETKENGTKMRKMTGYLHYSNSSRAGATPRPRETHVPRGVLPRRSRALRDGFSSRRRRVYIREPQRLFRRQGGDRGRRGERGAHVPGEEPEGRGHARRAVEGARRRRQGDVERGGARLRGEAPEAQEGEEGEGAEVDDHAGGALPRARAAGQDGVLELLPGLAWGGASRFNHG